MVSLSGYSYDGLERESVFMELGIGVYACVEKQVTLCLCGVRSEWMFLTQSMCCVKGFDTVCGIVCHVHCENGI